MKSVALVSFALVIASVYGLAPPAAWGGALDPTFGNKGMVISKESSAPGNLVALPRGRVAGTDGTGMGVFRPDGNPLLSWGKDGWRYPPIQAFLGFQTDLAVQRDSKLVGVGFTDTSIRSASPFIYRVKRDGSLDSTFAKNGRYAPALPNIRYYGVSIARKGRILVAGSINESTSAPRAAVFAFRPNGRFDKRFGKNGVVRFEARKGWHDTTNFQSVEVLKSGKVLAAGFRRGKLFVVRLRSDGQLDRSFGRSGVVTTNIQGWNRDEGYICLAVHNCVDLSLETSKGKILIRVDGYVNYTLYRFHRNGSPDSGFGGNGRRNLTPGQIANSYARGGGKGQIKGIAIKGFEPGPNIHSITSLSNGKTIAVGRTPYRETKDDLKRVAIIVLRIRRDGNLDRSFAHGGVYVTAFKDRHAMGLSAIPRANGKVLVSAEILSTSSEFGASVMMRFKR